MRQKWCLGPEKSHLRFAFSPVLTHQWGLRGPNKAKIWGSPGSRKRSPSGWAGAEPTFESCRAIPDVQVPQNLTFRQTTLLGQLLNPLTLCPGPAHRGPRTSSLDSPARSHHLSRKASPYWAETPARQGFAVALTFLTWVQRCLLLLLSSFSPRVLRTRPIHPPRTHDTFVKQ
jgi:hypothetical protein